MRSDACMLDTYMRIAPTHILLDRILLQATWAALRSDEAIKAHRRPPRDLRADILVGRRHLFSLAPGHRTSSLLAALLRFLQRAQFLLDQRCDSCLRFLAGRCAAAHGLRATCIRRAESSGDLEGFLPLPSEGYNISKASTSSMADLPLLRKFPLCIRSFHVRCSRTHPHLWERTSSACIIHLCSVFARPPPFSYCISVLRISLFSSYVHPPLCGELGSYFLFLQEQIKDIRVAASAGEYMEV
jgi:hypothetical protein